MATVGMTHTSIGKRLGIGRTTISVVVAQEAACRTVATATRTVRHWKASVQDLCQLQLVLEHNPWMKLAEVKDQLAPSISTRTVGRRAHELGFNNRVAVKKPFLSDTHKERRLQFAKEHESWTVDEWRNILWTDELSFEIGKNSRQVKVWRDSQSKFAAKNLVLTFKSGCVLTMVWGSFFGNKKGSLVVFPPCQHKAVEFIEKIYKKHLIPFLTRVNLNHHLTLMEDNSPIQNACASKAFLAEKSIRKIEWPAQSPDLNPLENVWFILKSNIQQLYQPRTVPEMHEALQQAWADFPTSTLDHLVESMPKRVSAVIKAEGGATRW